DFLRQSPNHRLRLLQSNVLFERVLSRDGFRRSVGDDRTMVDAACQFVESQAIPPEALFERCRPQNTQITYGLDADLFQSLFGHLAHARDASHGKWRQEWFYPFGLNDKQTIRLTPIGGD